MMDLETNEAERGAAAAEFQHHTQAKCATAALEVYESLSFVERGAWFALDRDGPEK